MMSEAKTITFSQYHRTRAEECRARGNWFRDPEARRDVEGRNRVRPKAKEAEAAECSGPAGDTLRQT